MDGLLILVKSGAYTSIKQPPDKGCNIGSIPVPSTEYFDKVLSIKGSIAQLDRATAF